MHDLDLELKKYKNLRLDLQQRRQMERVERRKKAASANDAIDVLIADAKRDLKLVKVIDSRKLRF